ncbi:MAG: recombination protein O N-terminal domain-containing protein [Bacteroidales bacterium]|nr:recombination protein O N-terminal domain-containing protein [Bacteroidales bacterium]
MYQQLRCVALRTIKYDDRRSIVSAWSEQLGRVSFIVPDGASREARRRRALLMPLSLFEGVSDVRSGRDLLSLRDLRPAFVLPELSCDPVKAMVAMFLAEVLERVLREAQPDRLLTAFLFESVVRLDSMCDRTAVANFALVFLYRLGYFAGIQPDGSTWRRGRFFDMTAACFRQSAALEGESLDPDAARLVRLLDGLTYDNSCHLHLPRGVRGGLLDGILRYYSLHHTPLGDLRSLEVVRDMMS